MDRLQVQQIREVVGLLPSKEARTLISDLLARYDALDQVYRAAEAVIPAQEEFYHRPTHENITWLTAKRNEWQQAKAAMEATDAH